MPGSTDLSNQTMLAVPGEPQDGADTVKPLAFHGRSLRDDHRYPDGDGKPYVVASLPIVHSDYSVTPTGVVIIGRYLGTNEVAYLATLTKPNLHFIPVGDPSFPLEFLPASCPASLSQRGDRHSS